MDPYVLRLVSRGKTPQTSRLEHIPKLWLRAPVRVELACSGPEDSAAALAAVANYSLAIHSLDADRKPVDSPLLWYQVVSPAGNTGATKGPHAVFEIGTAETANITEAGDYWIAVHAHTVDERIVRAAGYITLLDDGFPSTPPTPTPPGTVWLTQAAGDARYVNVTGDIMTGNLRAPGLGLRHTPSGFDTIFVAGTLTNDRELQAPDEDGTLATREWALANISGGGGGGGATNVSITADSTTVTVNSSTGSDGTISGATNAVAGVMTAAHVIALDGKVNKAGDTMTGLLTLPDIAVTNSATFGTTLAHNEISTIATAVRENQFPDAGGVFAVTGNLEGIPDKLGTLAKCSVAGGVTKGQVVYLHVADGTNPTFALANASSEATSSKTYGFIDRACAFNGFGTIITNGILEGLSIAAPYAIPGDSVWLSTVSGGIEVGLPPAKPAHSVYLGLATKVANSGNAGATIQTIEVKVQNGYELAELHDVAATPATANQALVWNSATSLWTPTTLTPSMVLSDTPYGDIAVTSSGTVWTVGSGAITYAKIQNVTAQAVLCRAATTPGTVGEITLAASRLLGRGTTGNVAAISVGNGLAFSGAVLSVSFGATGTTVCVGNDARLSDARTPTTHAASHHSGGTDAIKLDDLDAPDDNTDLNASTLRHGLLPKLSGQTAEFLAGDGAYRIPLKATRAANLSAVLSMGSDEILTAVDPGGNRLVYWNDTTNQWEYLSVGSNLSISGGALNATGGSGTGGDPVLTFRASQLIPATTNGAGVDSLENFWNRDFLTFPMSANRYAELELGWPSGWTSYQYRVIWRSTATSGNTIFTSDARCFADSSSESAGPGSAVNVTDSSSGTAQQIMVSEWSANVTPSGSLADGQPTQIRIGRLGLSETSPVLNQTVWVQMIQLRNGTGA